MHCRPVLSILLLSTLAATAQASKFSVPEMDIGRLTFRQTSGLDLGSGTGNVELSQLELRSLLSRPIALANDWLVVPLAEYTQTTLDINNRQTASPFHDEDLYSLGLSAFAVHLSESSPWIYGAWARGELATDFQHVTSDALTFDLAAAGGYRFNERFTLAFGAAVFNLNGHVSGYPLIGFDWFVSDALRVSLYGQSFVAAYTLSQDWKLSLRAKAGGGIWTVTDASGNSRAIDLTTYQIGAYAERRLTGMLWVTAGFGACVGNQLDYTTVHGSKLFERAPEAGVFGQIGVRLKL